MDAACRLPSLVVRGAVMIPGARLAAEEAPVAIDYAGHTHAVLMATPADVEDLAVGFTLTEGLVRSLDEIEEVQVIPRPDGLVARLWLTPDRCRDLEGRRRALAGPTGCGLCGVESLEAAVRPPPPVPPGGNFTPADIAAALDAMASRQALGLATRAAHAAALWLPGEGCVALREDVGRHNALDKLAGALAQAGRSAAGGIVVLSSRVSVEMVQKAARLGAAAIAAVSAPTALAVRTAEAAGVTLIAVVRADGFEIFAGAARIAMPTDCTALPLDGDAIGLG
ncbi:formate dehydrogenase accessory sulfurtransferase FdhD [Falsiroseomonas sp. HW251]|uniref:formate dehydrogenase accessory sulfurtransferase FdhD n=1 Tax=Falsiroseomonas sp. HW251 TaxID=3390998 RepID=UPI003D32461C